MMRNILGLFQPIGRALMLPIAVLPVAGLLLRLGQPDMFNIPLLAASGDALFSSLGLLFAIGVATGISRDGNGAAGLAGVVCYLIVLHGGEALLTVPADELKGLTDTVAQTVGDAWKAKAFARLDVPIGILSGLIAGALYNRYSNIKVPAYLAFFGGRRFVPIAAGAVGVILAMAIGSGYAALDSGLSAASNGLAQSGSIGLFGYGVLNRLLLVTGLHHILNNVAWFVLGDFHGTTGDLRRFFAGDPHAGAFMSGFFPVMMFGLPAACLAMYHTALPDQKKAAGGMLLSLALTSFLTGVTEPIEFSFMFLAPLLYAIHAVLTGVAMVVMNLLDVRLGFGFSAGLFDYLLNFGKATRPLLLLPVGAAYFAIYYVVFRAAILRFGLATPGRQPNADTATAPVADNDDARGATYLRALGGAENLQGVGACTTRLRLIVHDQSLVDDATLKALGAIAVLRPGEHALQVIIGPIADQISQEIRDALAKVDRAERDSGKGNVGTSLRAVEPRADILAALGGSDVINTVWWGAGRLRLQLRRDMPLDALAGIADVRGFAKQGNNVVHILGDDLIS